MTSVTRMRRLPAWQPTPAEGRLLAACLGDPERRTQALEAWYREHGGSAPDGGTQRLLPLALPRLLDIAPGSELVRRAQAIHLETSRLNLARIGRLVGALRHLGDAGVPGVVLKGAAVVLRYYRNYGTRAMADVDVLVRRSHVARAAAALSQRGWTPAGDPRGALLDIRMRLGHAWAFEAEPLHSLDLHWRLLSGGGPEVEELIWDALQTARAGVAEVRVPGATDQVFHACAHALQPHWSPSPRWIADVVTILDADGSRLDWNRLLDLAARTATRARLHTALGEVDRYAPRRVPPAVIARLESSAASWEWRELALLARLPPFGSRDLARWHWYRFRRLRRSDPSWRGLPVAAGLADYARLKLRVRRADAPRLRESA